MLIHIDGLTAKYLILTKTHTDSTSVFILTGNGNPEFGMEYVSIFLSHPSRSANFLPALRSLHSRLLTKSELTLNFISPDTTPPAVVKACAST